MRRSLRVAHLFGLLFAGSCCASAQNIWVVPPGFQISGMARDGRTLYSARNDWTPGIPGTWGSAEAWSPTLGRYSLAGLSNRGTAYSGFPFTGGTIFFGASGTAAAVNPLAALNYWSNGTSWTLQGLSELPDIGCEDGAGTADGKTLYGFRINQNTLNFTLFQVALPGKVMTDLSSMIIMNPGRTPPVMLWSNASGNVVTFDPPLRDSSGKVYQLWTKTSGFQSLAMPGYTELDVAGVSPSGKYVSGLALNTSAGTSTGFVWTVGTSTYTPVQGYGQINEDWLMLAYNADFHGNCLWSPTLGYANPVDIFVQAGGTIPAGLHLLNPVAMSDDGTTFLMGANTDGSTNVTGYCLMTLSRLIGPFDKPGSYSVAHNTTLTVPAPGILQFVWFASPTTVELVVPPKHAKAFQLNSDGSFSYTPMDGFVGSDGFWYRAHNIGGYGKNAFITISVT